MHYLTLPIDRHATFSIRMNSVIVMLVILCSSGNPALNQLIPTELLLSVLAVFLGILLLMRTRRVFSNKFLVISLIFCFIFLLQCIDFSFWPYYTIIGFFIRLFIGYAMMRLVPNFNIVFVRMATTLALLGLIFYVPYVLLTMAGINMTSVVSSASEMVGASEGNKLSIYFHTYYNYYSTRNCGMFWEPGAFSGYLCLALVFLAAVKNDLTRKNYHRFFLILSLALLTTQSTTGYVAYVLILILHYNWKASTQFSAKLRVIVSVCVILPLFLYGIRYAYNNISFLQEKISAQFESANDQVDTYWYRTRFGTLIFDWKYIQERPLTGWGMNKATRHALDPWMEEDEGMGNGMSDFMARMGITGFLTWFIMTFAGFWIASEKKWWMTALSMVIVLVILQGEVFLGFPLFLGLAFMRTSEAHNAMLSRDA